MFALVAAVLLVAGPAGLGPKPDTAEAVPTIGTNSCTVAGACDFLDPGVIIGDNSCNDVDACDSAAGTIGDDSCNAISACRGAGSFAGDSIIGDDSCNGESACAASGRAGDSVIGDDSCNGESACAASGRAGDSVIGDHSCNGTTACAASGREGGDSVTGDDSCNGSSACLGAASFGGESVIGDDSCNGTDACLGSGREGESIIGDHSCNGTDACLGAGFRGASAIGDCENNLVPVPACNEPPDCTDAEADPTALWPPNHRWVDVTVLGVTDPDGDSLTITVDSIYQDEPVNGRGDGNTSPDGTGVGSDTASVRAERAGGGNGRVYHIGFTADDGNGASCSGEVLVSVPKSQGPKGAAVDDGALYDSTAP